MASFRRRRSQGSSVSGTIAALIRQMDSSEWQAIQDAWKNGGEYKGEKVTDDYLLKYMMERRDRITNQDDPDWAQWDNGYKQTKFAIDESKIGLRFKQGKVSARTVSDFYKKALAQFPTDSEIYRDVAGKAADWAKSTAASARNAAANKARAALQVKFNEAESTKAAFGALEQELTAIAVTAGFLSGNQRLGDLKNPQDFWTWLGASNVPVTSPLTGQAVTKADWDRAVLDTKDAYDTVIAVQTQVGDAEKAAEARKERGNWLLDSILPTHSVSAKDAYDMASETYKDALDDAYGHPDAIIAARKAFSDALTNVLAVSEEEDQPDVNFVGAVKATQGYLNGIDSGAKTWEELTGRSRPGETPDTGEELLLDGQAAAVNQQGLRDGTLIYMQTDGNGNPKAGGQYQVVSPPLGMGGTFDPKNPASLLQQAIVTIDGKPQKAWIAKQPLNSTIFVTQDGKAFAGTPEQIEAGLRDKSLKPVPGPLMGYLYVSPDGKKRWGITQPNGTLIYTEFDPFAGSDITDPNTGQSMRYIPSLSGFGGLLGGSPLKTPVATDPGNTTPGARLGNTTLTFDQRTDLGGGSTPIDFTMNQRAQEYGNGVPATPITSGFAAQGMKAAAFKSGMEDQANRYAYKPTIQVPELPAFLEPLRPLAEAAQDPQTPLGNWMDSLRSSFTAPQAPTEPTGGIIHTGIRVPTLPEEKPKLTSSTPRAF